MAAGWRWPHWRPRALEVSIRQFRQSDARAVWELHATTNHPGRLDDLVDVDESYLVGGGDFLVAELKGGEVIATAALRPIKAGSTAAEVTRVLVRRDLRRRGIGTGLMDALHRRAAALGLEVAKLDLAHQQPAAVAFYHSLGYTEAADEQTGRVRELVKRLITLP